MSTHTYIARKAPAPAWIAMLASRRLTVAFFLLTAAGALAVAEGNMPATDMMLVPFALLAANIAAAVISVPRFRADLPLLLFHLCLVALVALLGLARLVYMEGTATLSAGTAFEGELQSKKQGLLHVGRLQEVRFANEGFTEDFFRRGSFRVTYNRVRWQDDAGAWHAAEIGDGRPLILRGYRIYTTPNRGFAPLFRWQPADGNEDDGTLGTVQLDEMPVDTLSPSMRWELPGGIPAQARLDIKTPDEQHQDPKGAARYAMDLEHTLTVKIRDTSRELQPGGRIVLPEGTLTYVRLDSWMGYMITYDPTPPWIIAVVLLGTASLVWFYWRRIW